MYNLEVAKVKEAQNENANLSKEVAKSPIGMTIYPDLTEGTFTIGDSNKLSLDFLVIGRISCLP